MIGQLSGALWLAKYLKRVTEMLCPFPCCDAVSWRNETKTLKPAINEAFVALSEDIMTDYNDSYSLFTYLVSWYLRTWVHFLARHEIRTNNYITAVSKRNKH